MLQINYIYIILFNSIWRNLKFNIKNFFITLDLQFKNFYFYFLNSEGWQIIKQDS